jgi:hypothetical protein
VEKEGLIMTPWRGPTIHYTETPDPPAGHPLFEEWITFRREMPRLLADGHEGKFVLIKGSEVIALFDTRDQARDDGLRRFGLRGYCIQQVLEYEPLYRTRAV